MAKQTYIGGSFAPPLTPAKLKQYVELAADASPQVTEAMAVLADAVEAYWKHKPSKQAGTAHPSGRGFIVPLEPETIKALDSAVPWNEELEMYAKVFDRIDPVAQRDLRNAAFHLLWFGRELFLDREPITADKL